MTRIIHGNLIRAPDGTVVFPKLFQSILRNPMTCCSKIRVMSLWPGKPYTCIRKKGVWVLTPEWTILQNTRYADTYKYSGRNRCN